MQNWQTDRRQKPSVPSFRAGGTPAVPLSTQIVDACLAGIILIAPFALGGRHDGGRLLFITLCCVCGVAWFVGQALRGRALWHSTLAHGVALAMLGLLVIQLVPLPAEQLNNLSPRHSGLLPTWFASVPQSLHLGQWQTLSLTPSATKLALATLIAYVLLFMVVIQRVQTSQEIERLVKLVACSAVLMALFGLIQYFTSNGLFFWFYEVPFTDTNFPVKGSFTNRNHFADFLALGLSPLVAWSVINSAAREKHRSRSHERRQSPIINLVLHVCLALLIFAAFMTLSRGGMIAIVVAIVFTLFMLFTRGLIGSSYFYALAMLGLVVVGLLSFNNYEKLANRIGNFTAGSIDELDGHDARRRIWAANVAAIHEGGAFGSGAGSHRDIYQVYLTEPFDHIYTHAENSYLQISTENGYIGIALLATTLILVAGYCGRALWYSLDHHDFALAVALSASLLASAAHAVVDFVWYTPACVSMVIIFAACVVRLGQLTTSPTPVASNWGGMRWWGMAAATTLAAVWAVTTALGPGLASLHWDKFQLASISDEASQLARLKPSSQTPEQVISDSTLSTECMIFHLRNVLNADPTSARAHLELASQYINLFETRQIVADNAMNLIQIRAAAMDSHFASARQLHEWLGRAFGPHVELLYRARFHTYQALHLNPLQGAGYLYLANLCFLEGKSNNAITNLVDQSVLLRPHDGQVLFEVGRQYIAQGRNDEAVKFWQEAYRSEGAARLHVLEILAGRTPAAAFLESFPPDWHSLGDVWLLYRQRGTPEDLKHIVNYACAHAETQDSEQSVAGIARNWLEVAKMQNELQNTNGALASLQRAYQLAPDDYPIRRALGRVLLKNGQYSAAETHLRWCAARNTGDPRLKSELIQAATKRTLQTAQAASHLEAIP